MHFLAVKTHFFEFRLWLSTCDGKSKISGHDLSLMASFCQKSRIRCPFWHFPQKTRLTSGCFVILIVFSSENLLYNQDQHCSGAQTEHVLYWHFLRKTCVTCDFCHFTFISHTHLHAFTATGRNSQVPSHIRKETFSKNNLFLRYDPKNGQSMFRNFV